MEKVFKEEDFNRRGDIVAWQPILFCETVTKNSRDVVWLDEIWVISSAWYNEKFYWKEEITYCPICWYRRRIYP